MFKIMLVFENYAIFSLKYAFQKIKNTNKSKL